LAVPNVADTIENASILSAAMQGEQIESTKKKRKSKTKQIILRFSQS
jgi:hypothetical protein